MAFSMGPNRSRLQWHSSRRLSFNGDESNSPIGNLSGDVVGTNDPRKWRIWPAWMCWHECCDREDRQRLLCWNWPQPNWLYGH